MTSHPTGAVRSFRLSHATPPAPSTASRPLHPSEKIKKNRKTVTSQHLRRQPPGCAWAWGHAALLETAAQAPLSSSLAYKSFIPFFRRLRNWWRGQTQRMQGACCIASTHMYILFFLIMLLLLLSVPSCTLFTDMELFSSCLEAW
jgi:hypothetical protein